ncbi:MAG: PTS sugar transporter subunit IIB [Chloroflexota bacterium]|nr:PTS sugar transporter subunit IIB [Chloroflexota bacterium]
MAIVLARVDDRLVHGQVLTGWVRELDARRIVVVDDAVARDGILREVIELAAPPDVDVEVRDVAGAVARLSELATDRERTILLVRSPATALALRRAGAPLRALNVGGVGAGPGRRRVHRTISLSPAEIADLRELEQLGTTVELRITPADRAVPLVAVA